MPPKNVGLVHAKYWLFLGCFSGLAREKTASNASILTPLLIILLFPHSNPPANNHYLQQQQ